MSKIQLTVIGLLLGGAAIIVVSQQRSLKTLRNQDALLRQQVMEIDAEYQSLSNRLARIQSPPSPRLPAAAMSGITAAEPEGKLPVTNLIAHLVQGGDVPRLTAAQLKRYLEENHRSAASLLSAYRTSADPALLQEAMEKYPGDPAVAFEAAFKKDASPGERREWLEAFKKAAPDNPMANYLSALDYFKSGRSDQALQELTAALGRQGFADYTEERIQTDEEAYRAAGFSEAEAKMAATWGVTLPQLSQLEALAKNTVALATSYRQAGDEKSAQAALQMAISMGRQLDAPSGTFVPLVTRLVGIASERLAFEAMDPSSVYGDGTVQQQLDQLVQRRDSIKDLVKQSAPYQEQMTADDWLNYNQRTRSFGEENAVAWMLNKFGQK